MKTLTERQVVELEELLVEAKGKDLLLWQSRSQLVETGYVAWRTRAEELICEVLDSKSPDVFRIRNSCRINSPRPTVVEYVEILKGIKESHLNGLSKEEYSISAEPRDGDAL